MCSSYIPFPTLSPLPYWITHTPISFCTFTFSKVLTTPTILSNILAKDMHYIHYTLLTKWVGHSCTWSSTCCRMWWTSWSALVFGIVVPFCHTSTEQPNRILSSTSSRTTQIWPYWMQCYLPSRWYFCLMVTDYDLFIHHCDLPPYHFSFSSISF